MSLFSVRPPVCELVFQLYGRPLHPELFDILAMRKIRRDDYELTVRITRTGHVITWENADVLLTEVAAAADQELPQRRRLLDYRLRGEYSGKLACAHGIHYEMCFQVEVLTPDLFLQVNDELRADGEKRGLLHNFPAQHRIDVAPLGYVTADGRPGCLCISTFHTFPQEYTVVKTQSLIEKHGERPA
jgi:Protein of unknown function DUF2617